MEGYANAGPLNGTAANAAPVGGRRHHSKKLKLIKKKTVRKMLKKLGLKMKGGDPTDSTAMGADGAKIEAPAAPVGGKKRHHTKKHGGKRRHTRSLFGLRY